MMVDTRWESQRDNDTDRYELERSIQASRRGGQTKSPGSKPIAKNGLLVCVLPKKAPVPDEPNVRPNRPDPSNAIFMPRRGRVQRPGAPALLGNCGYAVRHGRAERDTVALHQGQRPGRRRASPLLPRSGSQPPPPRAAPFRSKEQRCEGGWSVLLPRPRCEAVGLRSLRVESRESPQGQPLACGLCDGTPSSSPWQRVAAPTALVKGSPHVAHWKVAPRHRV